MSCLVDENSNKYLRGVLFLSLLLLCFQVAGIGGEADTSKDVIQKYSYSQGALTLSLEIDKTQLGVADTLRVELVAIAPEEWQIKYPEFGEKVGDFILEGEPYVENKVGDKGNKLISKLVMELEPFLSGEYNLPPLKVEFLRLDGSDTTMLETEKVSFDVVSAIDESDGEAVLRDIGGVLKLQKDYFYWYLFIGIGVIAVLGVAYIIIRKYLKRRALLLALRYPHELALERLRLLEKSKLIVEGNYSKFYSEVTDILRHYIGMRFNIKAAESTTEEFLRYISDEGLLIHNYSELLKIFLVHCDLVKFAKYCPTSSECHNVVESCREFIEQTKRTEID